VVGHALTDHPITGIVLDVSAQLQREMDEFGTSRWLPDEQVVLLARSQQCREAFDLHFPAFSHRDEQTGEWRYTLSAAQFYTTSAGALTLTSADPSAMPVIDHGYLTDPDMIDCNVLADGVEIALGIAEQMRAAGAIDAVSAPAAGLSRDELCRYVEETVRTCYHPSCSNRMGPASNPLAVVDANGQVHGLTNLYVCDASIFPIVPRANTNLPAAMVAEHLAGRIVSDA
jgi:choline dehydrogenase